MEYSQNLRYNVRPRAYAYTKTQIILFLPSDFKYTIATFQHLSSCKKIIYSN